MKTPWRTTTRHLGVLAVLLLTALAPLAAQQPAAPSPLEEALILVETGDPEAAIALLEPLRGQAGTDPRAIALLGTLYVESGRPADALAVLEPLAAPDGADPAVLFQAARAAQALGQDARAESYLVRSAAASPLSPAGRALGLARAVQGRFGEAFSLLYPWVREVGNDAEARLAATQAAVHLGRVPEARELLAGLDPEHPRVRLVAADLAMLQGDSATALERLAPLLADPPQAIAGEILALGADAHMLADQPARAVALLSGHAAGDPRLALLLARAQRQLGEIDAALATLRPFADELMGIEVEGAMPLLPAALLRDYGRFLLAAGRAEEAMAALRQAAAMDPASPRSWESLAEALASLGQDEEAARAAAQAQGIERMQRARPLMTLPQGDEATADLAPIFAVLANGDREQALEMLRRESERVPSDPRPHLLAVRVLLSLDPDAALREAEATVEAFPDLADAVYQRGAVRMGRGEAESAERDFRRALALTPDHTAAMNDLAVLLMTRSRHQEAKELLERVLALQPGDQLATENLRKLEERLGEGGG